MKLRFAALIVTAGLLTAAPARAETLFDSVVDTLSLVWSTIVSAAGSATEAVTPPTPIATLRSLRGEDKGEFWSMLEDAGYELRHIQTEVGLIPHIEATYVLRRELSDADREALETRLEQYARKDSGLIARLERAIIYSLLDASELGEYQIGELRVSFLPLPAASFTLQPSEGGMEGDHDQIFRAVKEQARELRHFDREQHQLKPRPVSNGSLLKP
jgi:hypothetical protein